MNNQFNFCFQTYKSLVGETYILEGRKYLCWSVGGKHNFIIMGEGPFPQLLVPDDNSLLANSIRNNPAGGEFYSIPFSDLKFQSQLVKKDNFIQDAFLVKNTNQVKKITEKEVYSPQILTFKVRNQKRTRWGDDPQTYRHHLEIEPFSLGLEGQKEISHIIFSFIYNQSLENEPNSLINSWLHNHKILEESAGKIFTMKVNWLKIDKNSNNELLFSDSESFDLDSFQEKVGEIKPESDNPNPPNQNPPSNPKSNNNSNSPKGTSKGLIVVLVILFILLLAVSLFFWIKKRRK